MDLNRRHGFDFRHGWIQELMYYRVDLSLLPTSFDFYIIIFTLREFLTSQKQR